MPRVLTLNAGSNHAKSNSNVNLEASFRNNLSHGNSFANVRNDDNNSSNNNKEPKVYQFEPCLSVCCGRFDHARGAMAVAAAGVLAGAAAAAATLYLVLEREQYEEWLPSEIKLWYSFFGLLAFVASNALLLSGLVTWRRNLFLPWLFLVFPINIFLFGAIFYLVYQVFAGDEEEDGDKNNNSSSNSSTSSSNSNKIDETVRKVQDVGQAVGIKYIFLVGAIVALVLNWYFWCLVWSLYVRMGHGCSPEHRISRPTRRNRRDETLNEDNNRRREED